MYTLNGRQKKALHGALRLAFPRHAALERLVDFHLDEHLAAIAGEGPLDETLFRLIEWAEAQGKLEALVNGARDEVPGNPHLIAFERAIVEARDTHPQDASLRQFAERVQLAPVVPDEPDLEKRVFRAGFADIAQWRMRLGQAELAVCRIESPAWRALGTGFLVGPDLVMTNRHVIDDLASQAAPPLVVRFDFKLSADGTQLREGTTFDLAKDWLVASSPVADLDFAVLRLRESAGLQPTGGTANAPPRGWITPRWRELEPDETVIVIQHPLGDTLKLATGRYDSRVPNRLRYRVDTEPGSSGSPCFTAQMELIGLHRGSAEGLANQGVPFEAIAAALPADFFPPAHTGTPAPSGIAAERTVDDVGVPVVERVARVRPRVSPALVGVGAAAILALGAVPLWWSHFDAPGQAARRPPGASSGRPSVSSEVSIPFASTERPPSESCRSDETYLRALYELESTGPWPAPDTPRSREVQLVVLGSLEIEYASMAMRNGVEARDVVQTRRKIVRKGLFAEKVVPPVVVLTCVRARAPNRPQPAFRLITWKEGVAP